VYLLGYESGEVVGVTKNDGCVLGSVKLVFFKTTRWAGQKY
jgi:hypothetical protein